MSLKQFIEKIVSKNPIAGIDTMRDLIELEAIEQRLNVLWGVELDIKIKKAPIKEGRFYGKSLLKMMQKKINLPFTKANQ
jgi:hypothetical protein